MKIFIITIMLITAVTAYAHAEEEAIAGRYVFYTVKGGNNDLALLLDSSTGKTWQVTVDSLGKVTQLSALTVEGLAYTQKDSEQLYSKAQRANIEGLSTSDSAVRNELDEVYGYGLDADKLITIRDKAKVSIPEKR